jgi:cytoskeletal protein RodZ
MSVGETLRRERLRLGIDLESLSQNTRIRPQYLEAIETDQPENCPGEFFYRSFVRQYALAVGLNAEQMDAQIREQRPAPPVPLKSIGSEAFPLKMPDAIVTASNSSSRAGKIWGSVVALVIVIIACSVLYTWLPARAGSRARRASGAPPVVQTPAPSPQPAAASPPAPAAAVSRPVPAPAPVDAGVTITVKATEKAWVLLSTEGQKPLIATLKPGEAETLSGRDEVRLRTGNAGGIEVSFNGKPVGPIGRRGQVRTVVFTPQGMRIAAPQAPDEGALPGPPVDTAERLQPPL